MLDEEQGRAHGLVGGVVVLVGSDDGRIEHGLQVIVAMLLAGVHSAEDIVYGIHLLRGDSARFVVKHPDALVAIRVFHLVKSVDDAPDAEGDVLAVFQRDIDLGEDLMLHVDDFEGREAFVNLEQLFQVADDDASVDEHQSIVFRAETLVFGLEEFFSESPVDNVVEHGGVFQDAVECPSRDGVSIRILQMAVDELGREVEDVAKDAVVYFIVLRVVGFLDACHHIIIECQLATDIAVDGCRREVVHAQHLVHHGLRLLDLLGF